MNMLEKWEYDVDSKCWTVDELETFQSELWMTVERFEKEL